MQDEEPDEKPPGFADKRRDPRRDLSAEAVIKNSRQLRIGGSLIDISENGCKIEIHVGTAEPGQIVTIKLGDMESWPGEIRWSDGTCVGVQFMMPLHSAIVDHLSKIHASVELL